MEKITVIQDRYAEVLRTNIRDSNTNTEDLQSSLYNLGEIIGQFIVGQKSVENTIITPLEQEYVGLSFNAFSSNVIISTKDDFKYFASGISTKLKNSKAGFMNFNGLRGMEALNSDIRDIELPIVSGRVESVVVSKSVLATGCTAIVLAKKALEKYNPEELIIVTAFHSKEGVKELFQELPQCKIVLIGEADTLDQPTGFLMPGVGNLDERIKKVA